MIDRRLTRIENALGVLLNNGHLEPFITFRRARDIMAEPLF